MLCRRRVGSFAQLPLISEPLLALHRVILRELGDDGGVVAHLAETASPARKAGSTAEGLRSVHQSAARARRRRPVCARQPRGRRRPRRRRGRLGGGGRGAGTGRRRVTRMVGAFTRCRPHWRGGGWRRPSCCGRRTARRWRWVSGNT